MNRFRGLTRRTALAALAAGACAPQAAPPAAQAQPQPAHPLWPRSGPPVLRGAVIAQRRRRDAVDGPPGAFAGAEKALPAYLASDFDALAEAGANLVVMSFPELWMVSPPYGPDPAMIDLLGRQLDLARASGLYVVVGLRSGPGRSDFIFHRSDAGSWFPRELVIDRIWTDPEAQAGWARMCVDAAKLLKDRPEVAGLIPMVEPDPNVSGVDARGVKLDVYEPAQFWRRVGDVSDWRRISSAIARQVREAAPDLPLLISPPGFARAEYVDGMGSPPVPGCVWCVHDYEPWALTHLARNAPAPAAAPLDGFARRIEAAQRTAPVFLGEFGAARWSPAAQRIYAARIAECETQSVNWAAFRWPTADAGYEEKDDMFNVAFGSDAARFASGSGAILPTLQQAWSLNTARPAALRGRL
jgi:hypothetical protein